MITFNGILVQITGGDEHERLATVEDKTGSTRIVGLERLRGTRGGQMEVVVVWREAIKRAEKEQTHEH
jgi:hypothetical protein